MLITILAAIFVFGLLVLVHELGHFITAKMVGMRVEEFALGFGPKLLTKQYGETLYSIRAIPLGGFNKIAGMDPSEEKDERSYTAKPVWARMIVILAGSVMNFILPIFLFFGVFFVSGIDTPSSEPVLGEVLAHKPAELAGLKNGDRIVAIDGQPIDSWKSFVENIQNGSGRVLKVEYQRDGSVMNTSLIPEYDVTAQRALIGVIASVNTYHPGFVESAQLAVKNTGFIIYKMLEGLGQMVTGKTEADLAGPLGVAQMAGDVAQLGFDRLLGFAAALSINLGIINLLPIPALDGGHFVTLVLEGVRGKPLNEKYMYYAQMIGFLLLMGLMIFATMNDFSRIMR